MNELIEKLLQLAADSDNYELYQKLEELVQNEQIMIIPYKKGEWAWHIYRRSKNNSKKGWTKRLVSWEQMVAGLAKDPNAIYVRFRDQADRMIEKLKQEGLK